MAFVCLFLSSNVVTADELSLSQAVELALKHNPAVASGKLSADAAKQAIKGARALTNPEISVAPNLIGAAGSDSAIFISQPLELNGIRKTRQNIAAFQATAASFDAVSIKQDLILRVKQAYWDIAKAQELIQLNQANLVYLETLRAAVQKQYDVGTVPGSQLIKTDVEHAKARQELSQAQLALTQAKTSLNSLMNRSMDHELTAIDRLTFVSTTIDREQLRNLAQTQRPEIASVQAIKDASKLEARAIQIKNSPDIAVQARTETFDSNTNCGIALVVSLPIFDWGSVKADKKQAEITTQSHEKRLESVENDISLDLEQAIIQVETSSQIVREYQGGILDKSDELAQMAQTGYEKGATSYLEVLEAQRTLRNIKTEYYTALADHAKSIAQLEWATGSGLTNTTATEVKK
jgi:cobalt-zinc-cadmium efflux system outer membrane protein